MPKRTETTQPDGTRSLSGSTSGRTRSGLRQEERLDALTEAVINEGTLRIDELAELFGVSVMTIHRDVNGLEEKGILRKSRGAVTALATSHAEASTEYRARQNRLEKKKLARAAAEFIEPGQAIMLDDSTIGIELVPHLVQRQPLTVITNFERVLSGLSGNPGITLISTGGQYYQWCEAFMGTVTMGALSGLRADIALMSTPAVTDGGCFHQHHDAVLVKQAMFRSARQRILYFDHTKFEKHALHAHHRISDFDRVIVDDATPAERRRELAELGASVVIAS